MEPTNETTAAPAAAVTEAVAPASTAPRMITFFKEGWNFVKTRKDLVGWYIGVIMLFSALATELVIDTLSAIPAAPVLYAITYFVLIIFMTINAWTLIYAVSQEDTTAVTFKQSFDWAASNFFPLLWTSILIGIAVIFGYILLIIPGIILSVYLYFALYAQALGSGAGTKAMKQSYRDVKGRWWKTIWKLIVLGFYVTVAYIAVALVSTVFFILGDNEIAEFIIALIVDGFVGGVIGVISIYAVAQYYKYLRANPVAAAEPAAEQATATQPETTAPEQQ